MRCLLIAATLAIAGCDASAPPADPRYARSGGKAAIQAEHSAPVSYRSLIEDSLDGDRQVLRVRVDAARDRLWVLGIEHVDVYDITQKRLIRRIPLPGWYVAELICPPDMALDRSGTVVISDNVQPRLWQVAGDTFQVTEHALRLVNREHVDIGFGGLAFAADGSLFGIAATGGSLWRIDLDSASARQVELGRFLPEACAWTVR